MRACVVLWAVVWPAVVHALCPVLSETHELADVEGAVTFVFAHHLENELIIATDAGVLLKLDKTTLQVKLRGPQAAGSFSGGVVWLSGGALFLGTKGFPASVHRFNLSTLQLVASVTLEHGEPEVSGMVIIPEGLDGSPLSLTVSVRSVPSHVIDFEISGSDELRRRSHIVLEPEENFAAGLTFNTKTNHILVLTDSIPPHLIELQLEHRTGGGKSDSGKQSVALRRSAPNPETLLPLVTNRDKENGSPASLLDLSSICQSMRHGERIFFGSQRQIFQTNTTLAGRERENIAKNSNSEQYVTPPELLSSAHLNLGHSRTVGCVQDIGTGRLFVLTDSGLLAYNANVEPFGHKESSGALCHVNLNDNNQQTANHDNSNSNANDNGASSHSGFIVTTPAIALDYFSASVYLASLSLKHVPVLHRFQTIPSPQLQSLFPISPAAVVARSRTVISVAGVDFAISPNFYDGAVRLELQLVRDSEEISTKAILGTCVARSEFKSLDTPLRLSVEREHSDVTLLKFKLPEDLLAGTYLATVVEHDGALSSQSSPLLIYNPPKFTSIEPSVVAAQGGALVTVKGAKFIDVNQTLVKIKCGTFENVIHPAQISATELSFRFPEVNLACHAFVKISFNDGATYSDSVANGIEAILLEHLTVLPELVALRGGAELVIKASGLVESDKWSIQFTPKSAGSLSDAFVRIIDATVGSNSDEQNGGGVLYAKAPEFGAPGAYSIDLLLENVKLTTGRTLVEVVNVTVVDISPHLVGESGGVLLSVVGSGFPKHHPVSIVIVPSSLAQGADEIEINAQVNDLGDTVTARLPELLPATYHVIVRLSSTEDIQLPHHAVLHVHSSVNATVNYSPTCIVEGKSGALEVTLQGSAHKIVSLLSGSNRPVFAAKLLSETSPSIEGIGHVVKSSTFENIESAVTASSVTLSHSGENPSLIVTATLDQAGKSFRVFVSFNGQEYHTVAGLVQCVKFTPMIMHPASGPISGNTITMITGTGHLPKSKCSGNDPKLRLTKRTPPNHNHNNKYNNNNNKQQQALTPAGYDAKPTSVVANSILFSTGHVVDGTTLTFATPAALQTGPYEAAISIDGGVEWTSLPIDLPSDNFVYFDAQVSGIDPPLCADNGGTRLEINGNGFPDSGDVTVRIGTVVVPAVWESSKLLSVVTPALTPGDHDVAVSFNSDNYKIIFGSVLHVYRHIPEGEMGVDPVVGPLEGGTVLSLTMRYGEELEHGRAVVRFKCAEHSTDVLVSSPIVSEPLPGTETKLATFTFVTPRIGSAACVTEISVARNGRDFHASGHHFTVYSIVEKNLGVSPILIEQENAIVTGSGFVDAGDEMKIRFSKSSSNPSNYVEASLSFESATELNFVVPELSHLFTPADATKSVRIQITLNEQQFITLPATALYRQIEN